MSNRAESVLVGLIGEGVMPSLTPPMHEREADVQGLRLLYRPIDLLDLALPATAVGDLLTAAGRMGFNGLNITHPCKQLVLQHLDEVSDDADRLGAVNTVLIRDGRFIGHNTDFSGFGSALTDGLPAAKLDRVVQLGAGGAGSAVAYALLKAGVKHLDLVDMDANRAAERATELSGLFPVANVTAHTPADLKNIMPLADGLVHCTPIGMAAHPGLPLDIGCWNPATGWRTSSIALSKRSWSAKRAPRVATCSTAAGWQSARRRTLSSSSPAKTPTATACVNTSLSSSPPKNRHS